MAKSKVPNAFEKEMVGKGYTKRGGEILKWEEGAEAVGTFIELTPPRDADSSPILCIRTPHGTIERWWAPAILESALVGIEAGTDLYVVCLGRSVSIKNRSEKAWGFEVYAK